MADDKKPQHAPAPKMELRPDGATARPVDRAAFNERQKTMSDDQKKAKSPEQTSTARREQFKANMEAAKTQAFNGERNFDKSKGPASREFNAAGSKNNGQER
jgi:hypothetical protein